MAKNEPRVTSFGPDPYGPSRPSAPTFTDSAPEAKAKTDAENQAEAITQHKVQCSNALNAAKTALEALRKALPPGTDAPDLGLAMHETSQALVHFRDYIRA